jgi:peptidyl-prolyl cis-trans isomerase B (cyclophilin B)
VASSQRDKELARQRAERQAAREAAGGQRRRQRNTVLASVAAVGLVAVAAVAGAASLGGDGSGTDTVASATTTTAPAAAAPASPSATAEPTAAASPTPSASAVAPAGDPGCTYEKTEEPAAREVLLPPVEGVELTQVYDVTIATDRGDIVFEMDSAQTPCTANNLRSLAHFRYFDDTACHRLTTEGIEVLQCGDPTGTGSGGPGYSFADENLEGATYPRGTVAMANAGPGTNGSQFFLVYGDSTLPPNYTPFGRVTKGLEILDEVAAAGTDDSNGAGDGRPKLPITIKTLRAKPQPG